MVTQILESSSRKAPVSYRNRKRSGGLTPHRHGQ